MALSCTHIACGTGQYMAAKMWGSQKKIQETGWSTSAVEEVMTKCFFFFLHMSPLSHKIDMKGVYPEFKRQSMEKL